MEKIDNQVKAHLFICCRHREEKGCCSVKGAEEMVKELKAWIKNENLKAHIKVSKSSCLGYCETGITGCIYPQNQWLHHLTPSDIPQLQKMLAEAARS